MANSERIGVVARPTYPSWKRVLTCSSGGGREKKLLIRRLSLTTRIGIGQVGAKSGLARQGQR